MAQSYEKIGSLQVDKQLAEFINKEALPGTEVNEIDFWTNLEKIVTDLMPKNKALLQKRDDIQLQLDEWHKNNKEFEFDKYKTFLEEIGYLLPEPTDVKITTQNVDPEIASLPGPQLVVPINNARYALNAANARWGSLYDALYGSNIISEENGREKSGGYNPKRGEGVIEFAKDFLDQTFPLANGFHKDATKYTVVNNELVITLPDGETKLKNLAQFAGYNGSLDSPVAILLVNNNIHAELTIDPNHPIGKLDKANIADIVMESAITTIMDCEDSVAAVDAKDKVQVYRNWLGLMKGDLTETFKKGDKTITRKLKSNKEYLSQKGEKISLNGRCLMLVRNVGHLMTNPAILTENGDEIPEGILDGVITSLIAKHDLLNKSATKNSKKGSVYIVKPKMHGPEEVAFANELFNRVEDALGLARYTLKIGVMDEERRTSLNLTACINEVKDRIVFINTGFLDRTGDEMHTSMLAGSMIPKNEMKSSTWLGSYEKSNVVNGLKTGFRGTAQIGKGMWAMPDLMSAMLEQKGSQLQAGANTAWVPSPTAATLHAIHYHQHDVASIQKAAEGDTTSYRNGILEIPLAKEPNWSKEEIQKELDNNAQGILGYVVRWVEQGIGCSKVPDINNIALMEDRATLRISGQHMTNWLVHGITNEAQIHETMERIAKIVDKQNEGDPNYKPMALDYKKSIAYQAALELVLEGTKQPNGYTEPILHRKRLEYKKTL